MKRVLCGTMLMILATSPAHAAKSQQSDDPRLDRESARAVQALTDSARAEKLPSKALTGVLQEGLSQHASGARIVRAMQDFLHALRGAAAALGPNSTEAELVSGAGALLAGVSPATLTEIRAARGKETVVVPLVVLGDLVARGVAAPAAGGAIANAARHGIPDRDFNAFRERVETAIASGSSASAALDAATRGVTRAAPAAPDSMTRRPKPPPGDPENYGRAEFDQASGNQTTVLRELSADALVHTRPRTPFAFAGNALLTDGSPLSAPSALANASMLAVAGTQTLGVAGGVGARLLGMQGALSVTPSLRAQAWERRGRWTFSIDAAFGAVPAWSTPGSRPISISSSAYRAGSGLRFDVAHGDSVIAPIPRASSPGTDSSSQRSVALTSTAAADAQFGIARVVGRFVFEGSAGIRAYASGHAVTWSSVNAVIAVSDRVGIVAGGTAGPQNPLWSTGGARFFAGVRLSAGRLLGPPARASVTETENVAEFRVIPGAVASTLEMRIAGAQSVELTGDFTDWIPVPLSTVDGERWSIARAIAPGVYRVRLRIDGGLWKPPPGLPCSPDAFGGEVGMMTVGVP